MRESTSLPSAEYDEWYLFEGAYPEGFPGAFINETGMCCLAATRIQKLSSAGDGPRGSVHNVDLGKLSLDKGVVGLWARAILRLRPISYIAYDEDLVVVTRDPQVVAGMRALVAR